jgi:hypothetical protein
MSVASMSIVSALAMFSGWICWSAIGAQGWTGGKMSLTFKVAMTPSAIRKAADRVSTQSNKGSLSSCRSLLYVEGTPLRDIMNPDIWPNTRPDLPRRSSSESGFFFCGMMEDPVLGLARRSAVV